MPPTIVTATALLFSIDKQPVVAVQLDIAPQWHIYWQNPGDSGLPTTLSTPMGQVETHYPVPNIFTSPGDITTYGYSDTATLFGLGLDQKAQNLPLHVSWLACKQSQCIPGETELFIQKTSRAHRKQLRRLFEGLPQDWPDSVPIHRTDTEISLHWPEDWSISTVEVFPDATVGLTLSSAQTVQHLQSTTTSLSFFTSVPSEGTAVITVTTSTHTRAYTLSL